MDILFENQYEHTREFYEDFYKEFLSYTFFKRPIVIAVFIAFAVFLAHCAASVLINGVLPYGSKSGIYICIIIGSSAMWFVRYFRAKKTYNMYLRDMKIYNGEPASIKTILTNEGISATLADSEPKYLFPYQSIKKVTTTRRYYVLFTYSKQCMMFKRDSFVRGTPDEFLAFIKSILRGRTKKSKKQIVLVGLSCGIALVVIVVLYTANGRTIFENRSKPTESELLKINEILVFEQEKLSECRELLSLYDDKIKELGIELVPTLEQTRAVNNQGLVETHNWDKDMWLPKFYSSKITCFVYKDGNKLIDRASLSYVSYFVDIYWLLHSGKNEDTVFNENPFDYFDLGIESLLRSVANSSKQ